MLTGTETDNQTSCVYMWNIVLVSFLSAFLSWLFNEDYEASIRWLINKSNCWNENWQGRPKITRDLLCDWTRNTENGNHQLTALLMTCRSCSSPVINPINGLQWTSASTVQMQCLYSCFCTTYTLPQHVSVSHGHPQAWLLFLKLFQFSRAWNELLLSIKIP
jgi:hypothetical protein